MSTEHPSEKALEEAMGCICTSQDNVHGDYIDHDMTVREIGRALDARDQQIEELRKAGQPMSDALLLLSQSSDRAVTAEEFAAFAELSARWGALSDD